MTYRNKRVHNSLLFDLYAFFNDIGLLAAKSGLDAQTVVLGNNLFTEYKGAFTEQFVMQQLKAAGIDYIGYWTNERSTAEVDL